MRLLWLLQSSHSAVNESDFRTAVIGLLRCGMSCRTSVKLTNRVECGEDTFRTLGECRYRVLRHITCFVQDMSDVVKCINCLLRRRQVLVISKDHLFTSLSVVWQPSQVPSLGDKSISKQKPSSQPFKLIQQFRVVYVILFRLRETIVNHSTYLSSRLQGVPSNNSNNR